ncbi:MAG: Multidrug efflux pump subunit AcrA precursor [Deltaproteobacteria bacterium ADurb.Bin510]|nr:MAG: Multidrug efflux pump subunit AcrA precursor [Deltaproteobacteria bacterium ADurb.Bin510]
MTASQPTALTTIQKLDPIYLDVPQSTSQLLRLKRSVAGGQLSQSGPGQRTVKLLLDDGAAYAHDGTLQFQDVTVNPSTGTVTLRATFPNPDEDLLPGMFARAVVQEGVSPEAILVPQAAVARDPKGNPQVMLVGKNNLAEQRPIVLDRAIGDQWLVSGGLKAGEQLIVEGFQKCMPGAPVRIAKPAAAQPAK